MRLMKSSNSPSFPGQTDVNCMIKEEDRDKESEHLQVLFLWGKNCLHIEHIAENVTPIGESWTLSQRVAWVREKPSILGAEDISGKSKGR